MHAISASKLLYRAEVTYANSTTKRFWGAIDGDWLTFSESVSMNDLVSL